VHHLKYVWCICTYLFICTRVNMASSLISSPKFLSAFTQPYVVQNLYEFLSSVELKRRYVGKELTIRNKNTMEVNGYRQLSGHQHFSKYLLFVFNRWKKVIQVWNNIRGSKLWLNFNWVNYPFKTLYSIWKLLQCIHFC